MDLYILDEVLVEMYALTSPISKFSEIKSFYIFLFQNGFKFTKQKL